MNLKNLTKLKRILLLLLAITALSGCGGKTAEPQEDVRPKTTAANGLSVRRAKNFHIDYLADGVKLVIDSAGRELLLSPEGVKIPDGYGNAARVSTPVRQVMYAAEVCAGFLEVLEQEGAYIALDNWIDGEGNIDVDSIMAADPGFVFTDMSSETGAALCAALDGLGVPYAVLEESREAGVEAYLEWLKFFGAFFDLDKQASEIYDTKLDVLRGLYAQITPVPESERPVVACGRIRGGVVYTHGKDSIIARQLERAGGVYALKDVEGNSVQLSMEEFLNKCKDADILLYEASSGDMWGSLTEEDERFAEFKAWQERRVYMLDEGYGRNGVKVVEQFEDLIAICHPEKAEEHGFVMYRALGDY